MIAAERLTAAIDGDFVLFLIGMRINRPWRIHRWWRVTRAMGNMIAELQSHPELGLLHVRTHGGLSGVTMVQYWRSHEQLQAYATSRDGQHLTAWRDFNRAIGTNGDVGIWHETYLVGPGQHESIYVNMPPYGLGRAGQLVPAAGQKTTAKGRLGH